MNILFLSAEDYYSSYPEQYLPIYNKILKNNFKVNFRYIFRHTQSENIVNLNNGIFLIPRHKENFGIFFSYYDYFIKIKSCIKKINNEYKIELIHSFDEPMMGLASYLFSRKKSIPFIYQVTHLKEEETLLYVRAGINGHFIKNYLKGKFGFILRNWLLKKANIVFAVSLEMKKLFIDYGVQPSRIVVIPAAINFNISTERTSKEVSELSSKYKLAGSKVIFYMGTLNRFRKLDILLDILKRVNAQLNNTKLLVVGGTDSDREWFKSKVDEYGLGDKVVLTGLVDRNSLYSHIMLGDVCLAPYEKNIVNNCNSPVKLLEYIMMKRFVVGTNIPSQIWLISEYQNGITVDHDAESFSKAIINYFERPKDISADYFTQWLEESRSFEAIGEIINDCYKSLTHSVK